MNFVSKFIFYVNFVSKFIYDVFLEFDTVLIKDFHLTLNMDTKKYILNAYLNFKLHKNWGQLVHLNNNISTRDFICQIFNICPVTITCILKEYRLFKLFITAKTNTLT